MPSHCRITGFALRIALMAMGAACAFTVAVRAQPVDLSAYGIDLSAYGNAEEPHRHRVTVGLSPAFPPFHQINDSGELTGFSIDLLDEVESRTNLMFDYRVFDSWPEALAALRQGTVDVLPSLAVTRKRAGFALFSTPVADDTVSLFLRADTTAVDGLDDLLGLTVAVVVGDVGQGFLGGRSDMTVRAFASVPDALVALLSDEVDGLVFPRTVGLLWAKRVGLEDRIRFADKPVTELRRAVAVRVDAPELASVIHLAVSDTVQSEVYEGIHAKWFGDHKGYWTVQRLSWATGAALVLVAVMASWRYASVVKLNRRQREALARLQDAMQELMLAKEEAQLANRTKDTFLAHMSHELRTPLNSILGFSECISNQIFGKVGRTEYLEYAGYIHDAGGHLLSLINDLLDIAKIEAGQQTISEEMICLGEAVSRCVEMVRGRALQAKIRISAEVPDTLPRLYADPRVCKQIMLNLLSNAMKFTPEGGEVSVSVGCTDGSIWLQVADTGCGIPAEQIPEIMKPFRQVEDPLIRRHEGTGLGLCLVDNLIKIHGGSFEIESEVGVGTVVTVHFPPNRTGPVSKDDSQQAAKRQAA